MDMSVSIIRILPKVVVHCNNKLLAQDICHECLALARQSLSFLKFVVGFYTNEKSSLCLYEICQNAFDFGSNKDIQKFLTSTNNGNDYILWSLAFASSLVISPPDNVQSLALTTFKNVFISNKPSFQIISLLVSLIPLGLEPTLMERCFSLFHLVSDLICAL